MRLAELLTDVAIDGGLGGAAEIEIAEVRDDSRAVGPGDLFVAVRGQTVDGHQYLGAAAERGAVGAVVERDVSRETFPGVQVRVASGSKALARIAANRYGRPASSLAMIGITGTNGKTTTTFLAEALGRACGEPGVLGTVTYRWKGASRPAPFTTPTPLELHATLAEMRAAGCTHVAMECSSHALELDRLEGVAFQVAAFTNLTQDHLDFHGTMEAYRDSKARLFAEHVAPGGSSVILIDREYGEFMARAARGRVLRVSAIEGGAGDVTLVRARREVSGIEAEFATPVGAVHLRSPLIGQFNVENLAVAVGIGVGLGLSGAAIGRALSGVTGVPGRLERVGPHAQRGAGFDGPHAQRGAGFDGPHAQRGAGFDVPSDVFVDYAHTPDALERVMAALRPLTRGRLIVVFGCGGDRDRTKRPKMGRAVARDADLAIVTSDNPRTEEPGAILEMILDGVRAEPSPALTTSELASAARGHVALVDRREAIRAALSAARSGDAVLIAGKGHEDYQIVGKTKHHFDDREEAAEWLRKLALSTGNDQS